MTHCIPPGRRWKKKRIRASELGPVSHRADANQEGLMPERSTSNQGVVVGLIGAGTVAAWFLLLDVVQGRPFFTPALLGSALFQGLRDMDQVEITAGVVLGYTAFHLIAFIVLGIIAVAAVRRARRTPPLILGIILVFVTLQALFLGSLTIAAEYVLGALAWWGVAVGNLLAALAMGMYLWKEDPALKEAVERKPFHRKQ